MKRINPENRSAGRSASRATAGITTRRIHHKPKFCSTIFQTGREFSYIVASIAQKSSAKFLEKHPRLSPLGQKVLFPSIGPVSILLTTPVVHVLPLSITILEYSANAGAL